MFTQSILDAFHTQQRKTRRLLLIETVILIFCLVWTGYAYATNDQALIETATTITLVALLVRFTTPWILDMPDSDILWSDFTAPLSRTKTPIVSPVLGDETHTRSGRTGGVNHYQTQILDYVAMFDKVTVGYQLFGYNPERHYSDVGITSFSLTYLVLAIELNQPLPHIFIDGRSQNRFGFKSQDLWSLTKKLSRQNKMQALEGDFYKHFDVYTADKKHIEALTIATPDTMIALRDEGYSFDYELYGTKLYVIAEPQLKQPADYEAYIKAVIGATTELVPQIAKHTFSHNEPTMSTRTYKVTFWAWFYGCVSIFITLLKLGLMLTIAFLSGWLFNMLTF